MGVVARGISSKGDLEVLDHPTFKEPPYRPCLKSKNLCLKSKSDDLS